MGSCLSVKRLVARDGAQVMHVDTSEPGAAPDPVLAMRVLQRGEVAIVPASAPCVLVCAERESADFFGVIVESRVLATIARSVGVAQPPIDLRYQHGIPDPAIRELLEALQRETDQPGLGTPLYIDTVISQLMIRLLRAYSDLGSPPAAIVSAGPPALDAERLQRAIRFIQEHLDDAIAVVDIARAVDLSPYHFSRAFKQSTGEPPHRYLLRQRLERARALVLDSAMPLAEVAAAVGFYDQSHFGHHFKRRFGATPREARERKNVPSR
ncbi:MAG: helix-turn-helix domain-containing protein [Kofleriaceae bacterium]